MPNYMRDLNLPLDPAPTEEQIFETLKKRRITINTQANQGRMSPEMRKKQLAELDKVESVMRNPVERTKAIAAELSAALDFVRRSVAAMQQSGIDTYTMDDVEAQAKKLNIQAGTVARVYSESGFHEASDSIVPVTKIEIPKRYSQENPINEHIRSLWSLAEDSKNMVSDLYSFMAYYSGLSSASMSRDELIHMDRDSLSLQVEQWARDCAMNRPRNALTTALNNLLADCQTMLKSDETQKEYHVSIQFATCKALIDIDAIPGSARTNQQYADTKIKEIAAHFHVDENVALAIYNDRIKPQVYTPQAPYRPTVQCPNCNQLIAVKDQNGHKVTQCPICKEKLYVKCRCGKTVAAVTERCSCGRRIYDRRYIPDYARTARLLIDQNQYGRARQVVNQIVLLDDQAEQLDGLNKALESFTKKQTALYRKLDMLCNAKEYYAARACMQNEPELSIGYRRAAEIEKHISDAEELKQKYGAAPTEEQANQILNMCADIPGVCMPTPRPARRTRAQYNDSEQTVAISWEDSESSKVSTVVYDVHRQVGGKKPEIIGSGRIASDLKTTNYVDQSAPSGANVWYYVVAKRNGKCSDICPIPNPITVMHEVDESYLTVRTDERRVRFVWAIPSGAQGVRILRGGTDMNIQVGSTSASMDGVPGKYEKYEFQAVYEIEGIKRYTQGITRYVAPTSLKPLRISVEEQHNGHLKATWSRQTENTQMLFILTFKKYCTGEDVSEDDIHANAVGKRVYSTQVSECECDLGIVPVGSYQIVGFINIAGVYKACPPITYSNTPAVNTKGITYDNGLGSRIILRNVKLPVNASGIIAFLGDKKVIAADSSGGKVITAAELTTNQNSISLTGVIDNAINYVTLYVYYDVGGCKIYSDPSVISISTKERKKITCLWEWNYERTGSFLRKTLVMTGATLKIMMPSDSEYCPSMRIIGRESLPPKSESDGTIFMNLEEVDEEQYPSLFLNNERIIHFDATPCGEQVNLQLCNEKGIVLRQTTITKGCQLKMFVGEMGYQIQAIGSWSVP